MSKEKCKICSSSIKHIFNSTILGKYDVGYYKCSNCGFIQTDEPYWLDEAYGSAITTLDLGLISRNLNYAERISSLIISSFDKNAKFLDYAGGYGMFTRLMRDKGFDYYHQDKFCTNLYAQNFELTDLPLRTKFEFTTAFEVFEHFSNPLKEIEEIFKYSDTVVFSTELQPDLEFSNSDQWWYFTPETGQHVAFYSKKSLEFLANKMNLFFYTQGSLHVLSKRKFDEKKLFSQSNKKNSLESLLQKDFDLVKKIENLKTEKIIKKKSEKSISEMLFTFIAKFESADEELKIYKDKLLKMEEILKNKEVEYFSLKSKIVEMQNTRLWKMAERARKYLNIMFPKQSHKREYLKKIIVCFKYLIKIPIYVIKIRLINIKRNWNRKTNKNSKKIVYIGHSYHDKTKSTSFLIDYLKKYFKVEIILDETWLGKSEPNLDFIDDSYLGVIFFQNIYSPEIINKIKNKNIIFFPMYDGSGGLPNEYWKQYENLKFINFSKTLHLKLLNLGLDSIHVQYFPKPKEFIRGEKNKVFFWQRLTHININTVEKLFKNKNSIKIHLHKAIDPKNVFIKPSKKQATNFSITYSDWFKNKNDLLNILRKSSIYIAPREHEGIGLSFLEAMSMGKIVVAVNNPTMNEYIKHEKNGYLFDLSNVKEIDLSSSELIQKKCYKFMIRGYKNWEKRKIKIINFIRK